MNRESRPRGNGTIHLWAGCGMAEQDERLSPGEGAQLRRNWHRLSARCGSHAPRFQLPVPPSDWRPGALACLARGHSPCNRPSCSDSRREEEPKGRA